MNMKKIVKIAGCAIGGAMIGFFANQLSTVWGAGLFALGVVLLVFSIASLSKQAQENKEDK